MSHRVGGGSMVRAQGVRATRGSPLRAISVTIGLLSVRIVRGVADGSIAQAQDSDNPTVCSRRGDACIARNPSGPTNHGQPQRPQEEFSAERSETPGSQRPSMPQVLEGVAACGGEEGFEGVEVGGSGGSVSYTHLRAHETDSYLVCRLLL